MCFTQTHCVLKRLSDIAGTIHFVCGDKDLDDFFANDCQAYEAKLLGKTYCYCLKSDKSKVVCAFTLANASLRVSDLPNARRKKVEKDIPHTKTLKEYPAVLVARLAVSEDYKAHNIGSQTLDFVKRWFVHGNNKTGCRFVVVDAYNNDATILFYEHNGFKLVFSTVEQELEYRRMDTNAGLTTRLMFFDLAPFMDLTD